MEPNNAAEPGNSEGGPSGSTSRAPRKKRDFSIDQDGNPRTSLPDDYKYKGNGIWFLPNKDDGEPYLVVGSIDVVAQTRDLAGSNWGLLINWPDADGRSHTWAMPKSMLASSDQPFFA